MGMIKNGFTIILIHMTLKRSQYLAHLAFILFFHWTHLFFSFKTKGKLFKTAMLLCELFTSAHKQAQARETTPPKHGCSPEIGQGEICGINTLCDCRTSLTFKRFRTVYSIIPFPPCSLKCTLQSVVLLNSSIQLFCSQTEPHGLNLEVQVAVPLQAKQQVTFKKYTRKQAVEFFLIYEKSFSWGMDVSFQRRNPRRPIHPMAIQLGGSDMSWEEEQAPEPGLPLSSQALWSLPRRCSLFKSRAASLDLL